MPLGKHKRWETPPEQVLDRGAHGRQGNHQVCNLKDGNACEAPFSTTLIEIKHQASDTTILTFEDVRVPVEHIIGEEGMGFTYQMLQFQVGAKNQNLRIV